MIVQQYTAVFVCCCVMEIPTFYKWQEVIQSNFLIGLIIRT